MYTKKEQLEKLNNYLERFINQMINSDIKILAKINEFHQTSYPYLALAFSGIDFFGGLEKGFKKNNYNSGERFRWFINEWMGKINDLYNNEDLAFLIYNAARCGILHQAVLKNSFNISSYPYLEEKHLHYMENSGLIFIHSMQFALDFINAQKKFRENLNNSTEEYVNKIFGNFKKMLNELNDEESKNQLGNFINELKNKKLTFDEINNTAKSSASSISSVNQTTTVPPDNMNNLKLNISKIDIELGMTLNINNLKSHNFRKLGLLNSFLIKKNPGEKIYWAKNCDISCFDNEFSLCPCLNTNIGADKMYGTSAYLYFKNNQLNKVIFQLVGNDFAANWIIDKFKDLAEKKLGKANKETGNLLWNNLNDKFIAEKLPNSQHAYFHWIKK